MAQQNPPTAPGADGGTQKSPGDPWHAFGYLTSGVFFYGLVGWALDRWLDTSFLVVVGILAGALLGLYLTWARFRPTPDPGSRTAGSGERDEGERG